MRARCEKAIAYVQPAIPDDQLVEMETEDSAVFRAIAEGLIVSYLIEDGEDLRYVQRSDLKEAGMSAEDLHRSALTNLAQFAEENILVQSQGKVFATLLGGNFEASVILLDGLWDEGIRHTCKNDFVAALPARDILAFCDCESAEGLAELRAIVDRVWEVGSHLVTRTLYRRRGRKWVPVTE